MELMLEGPAGEHLSGIVLDTSRFALSGRDLYRARVPLKTEGRWRVEAEARVDGGAAMGSAAFEAFPDEGTPALGTQVPGGATPTLWDARDLMAAITSDPEPVSAF